MSFNMTIEMRDYEKKYIDSVLLYKYNLLNQIVIIEDTIIDESYKPKVETTKNLKKINKKDSKILGGSKDKENIIIITND